MKKWYCVPVILTVLLVLSVTGYVSVSGQTESEDIPDITGTWTGPMTGIRVEFAESVDEHPAGAVDHGWEIEPDERLIEGSGMTFVFDMQDGRRFSGVRKSPKAEEVVIGVISHDNESLYMVDQDGQLHARLLGADQMEVIYLEANKGRAIASVRLLERQP